MSNMIKVLEINPGKKPEVVEIENELETLQELVGGYIECVYPWDDEAALIVNEEGKIIGLPLNRALRDEDGDIFDIVAGAMIIVGLTEDDFGSLTDEQIEWYTDMFKYPEQITIKDGSIYVKPEVETDNGCE